jgi:folate-dependent tRNA-U54 methylase TrmFO/GidA
MKANFGILPSLETDSKIGKRERGKAYAERALKDLQLTLSRENLAAQADIFNTGDNT